MNTVINLRSLAAALAASFFFLNTGTATRANVYVTNIRLVGTAGDAAIYIPCGNVTISYLLNEPATAGLTIDILNGDTVAHSIVFAGDKLEADRGEHAVTWTGHDAQGILVPLTNYTVRITAAANGYEEWTQISTDFDPGSSAWDPTSIAVNCNTNSPYYGQVYVANASPGPNPGFNPGDLVGILKLNADGSRSSSGAHSTGGWRWAGDGFSPWKIEVAADDTVNAYDWTSNAVLRFDQMISAESRSEVLRSDNFPAGAEFSGLAVTGSGTNTQLWMTDANAPGGVGVRRWQVGARGTVATNDLGVTVVQAGTNSDLSLAPYDVTVDSSNRIFALQYREALGDPAMRVLCFLPYTNGAAALTNAQWKVGSGNNSMRGASGVAVDPTGRYVAAAFAGSLVSGSLSGGRTMVLNATNGQTVTSIITDIAGGESHDHLDVAWDNVGNLYDVDNYEGIWRVFSPPGSNAAATVALVPLRVSDPPLGPILQTLGISGGKFHFLLTGRTNVNYAIQASTNLTDWTSVATNSAPASCSTREASVNVSGARNFYRATPASQP